MSDPSLANNMIRPRILYLSTESATDAFDSSSVRFNLPDAIYPQDGFSLVAGLRSFGFNATAWNISEEQKNNRLSIDVVYYTGSDQVPYSLPPPFTFFEANPLPSGSTVTVKYRLIIPEGLYQSMDELCEVLSGSTGETYFLDTRFKIEPKSDIHQISQLVGFSLQWQTTSFGFQIFPQKINSSIYSHFQDLAGVINPVTEFTPFIQSITISPQDGYPKLFNLLFTNNISPTSPSVPIYATEKYGAKNPPAGIQFLISKPVPTPDSPTDTYSPYSEIFYDIREIGNEAYLDSSNNKYQLFNLEYKSLPWKSFSTPRINPLYLDVACQGIPTNNLTAQGLAGNLLHRQFLNGANQGLEGLYQEFNVPVWTRLENRDQITQMTFDFSTENDLWTFYNMSFYLELVFFEVEEEKNQTVATYEPPGDDPLTAFLGSQMNPHADNHTGGRRADVLFSQRKRLR